MLVVFLGLLLLVFKPVFSDLAEIVDLTWPFDNETIYWEDVTKFHFTKVIESTEKGYFYAAKEFSAGEHGGTHFDAPYHFNQDGWKVGEVPITRLIAKGAVLQVSGNKLLLPQHLDDWVQENGQFDENTVLLVKFNRSHLWPNRTLYMGEAGNLNFPSLSREAADWIAKSGKIVGVGLDTPSVDPGDSEDFVVHRILSKALIYNLENVKLVEDLPVRGFTLLVLPMKIKNGTGAPVRILAVPKSSI